MAGQESHVGDSAWRRIERLLPTPDELPQVPENPDTELHWMPGPPQPIAGWFIESLNKAAAERRVHPERGEVRIPGVPQRREIRPSRRKPASFRDVVGDESADQYIEVMTQAREAAYQRRMADPVLLRFIGIAIHRRR